MTTPPGVDRRTFERALAEFGRAIGKDWVFSDAESVSLYRDAYSPLRGEPQERVASAALAPASTEEVQAVVRIANRHRIPLYPISTGRNLGYGGSAPAMSGSVVLDLKRMNRILEVNEKEAWCLVEPGVSYFDLYEHLSQRKIALWADVPEPGWGSVVGNALDRGAGFSAVTFRNHFDAHCGMEVVLPNGELMRTGMGAMPGSASWQVYKSGFGPWVDGLFSQSGLGVVTKMGFWLMPEPEAFLKGAVHLGRFRDLEPLVDAVRDLENRRIYNGYPEMYSPGLGMPSLSNLYRFLSEGPGEIDPEYMALLQRGAAPTEYEPLAQKRGRPFWSAAFSFYGPEKVIRAQWEHVQDHFRRLDLGARFEEREFYRLPLSPEQKEKVEFPAQFGIPNLRTFALGARAPWNPAPPSEGHLWLSFVTPRTAQAVLEANEILGREAKSLRIALPFPMTLPICQWERCFMFIIPFWISQDPAANRTTRDAFARLVDVVRAKGWGEYRTAPAFQDLVMSTYSFNDSQLLRFHEAVKDALDPNGIVSPGRYGIWPRHMRKSKERS